jgi:hypothetical protein
MFWVLTLLLLVLVLCMCTRVDKYDKEFQLYTGKITPDMVNECMEAIVKKVKGCPIETSELTRYTKNDQVMYTGTFMFMASEKFPYGFAVNATVVDGNAVDVQYQPAQVADTSIQPYESDEYDDFLRQK